MSRLADSSAVQQLTELLVQLALACDDEQALLQRALETIVESVEAEVAAVVRGGEVDASVGFARGAEPVADLRALAGGRRGALALGTAALHVAVTRLDEGDVLVLGRRHEAFTAPEMALAQGMTSALALCLRSAHLLASEREARRRSDRQAREARRDPLTHLPNRAVFFECLAEATGRARAADAGRLAVLFMDLDGFKHINDTLGHHVGDELLRAVAGRLRGAVRRDDVVARLGGDEFAVLVEGIDGAGAAERLAAHLCDALAAPFSIRGRMVSVRSSIGIAMGPHPSDDPQLLLRDADVAMYRAKADRPGGFVVFDEPMREAVTDRAALADDLRTAIRSRSLELAYQPVVELGSLRTMGIEALLRWHHAERGDISPATFVPLAEELGLVFELGDWVLDEACGAMAALHGRGVRDVNIAVNVSSHQLHDAGFAERVRSALATHRVAPSDLVLEITETAALSEDAVVFEQLAAIDQLGIPIALDDFGTGYSSLSHLIRLPISILKIDRVFVGQLQTSNRHAALTESVVALGRRLDLDVVAEGIEHADQLLALEAMGCPFGQGYLFGRPGPPEVPAPATAAASPSRS
ncbi:MAG: putative bifunctional diguanylate cyclase/phosphodiesterase [Acidimicrobiia bacterium]